jgi:hypothetical protein
MKKVNVLLDKALQLKKLNQNTIQKNTKKIDDIEFLKKYIWIINKKKERQRLTLNNIQLKIEAKIKELRANDIPPRIIILKARQEGVTTYSQGKMMSQCVQNKDMNCLIVSHQQDSTNAIFSKTKFMYNNLDNSVKPLQKASNARELIFDVPRNYKKNDKGLNSKIVVKIAGKESIGRSDTYSFVHLSEFAFWSGRDDNSPQHQLSAIMQALPRNLDSLAIIESTAKGFNDFKDVWDKAVAGENGWYPLFFPWFDDPDYRIPVTEPNFEDTLDDYEKKIRKEFNLDLDQINWYRYTKKTDCNNDYDSMKQENPSFPEEAFIFSGTPVFDNNLIMNRINYLKNYYKKNPYISGEFKYYKIFEEETINVSITKFRIKDKEDKNFYIRIYEKPILGYPYTIGADTKGEGRDFFTATVCNCITGNTVAVLKSSLSNSVEFTMQLYCLGMYYNGALIGVEINFNTSPIERLVDLRYFSMYQRERKDDFTGKLQPKWGWKTDKITRPLMIDNHIAFVDEHIECFFDIETLREMLTFVKDENGKPDAQSGYHDDLLFSHMISREIQSQKVKRIDVDTNKRLENIEFSRENVKDDSFSKCLINKIEEINNKYGE